ncbi:hypothetical protein HZS_6486, partial [Henneguya salminicola]
MKTYILYAMNTSINVRLSPLSRNPNFSDLGYKYEKLSTDELIDSSIQEIDKTFNLVMITELWEKSLILLKHKLCLNTEEVIVFDANVAVSSEKDIPDDITSLIMDYNYADNKLYKYFYDKLINEAKSIKRQEILELRANKISWENKCIAQRIPKRAYASKKYLGYKLKDGIDQETQKTCESLVRSEIEYVDFFR